MNFRESFIGYNPHLKSYLIPIYKNAIATNNDINLKYRSIRRYLRKHFKSIREMNETNIKDLIISSMLNLKTFIINISLYQEDNKFFSFKSYKTMINELINLIEKRFQKVINKKEIQIEENKFKYKIKSNDKVIKFMNLLDYEERGEELFKSYTILNNDGYRIFDYLEKDNNICLFTKIDKIRHFNNTEIVGVPFFLFLKNMDLLDNPYNKKFYTLDDIDSSDDEIKLNILYSIFIQLNLQRVEYTDIWTLILKNKYPNSYLFIIDSKRLLSNLENELEINNSYFKDNDNLCKIVDKLKKSIKRLIFSIESINSKYSKVLLVNNSKHSNTKIRKEINNILLKIKRITELLSVIKNDIIKTFIDGNLKFILGAESSIDIKDEIINEIIQFDLNTLNQHEIKFENYRMSDTETKSIIYSFGGSSVIQPNKYILMDYVKVQDSSNVYHISNPDNIFDYQDTDFKTIHSQFQNINTKEELFEKLHSSEDIHIEDVSKINPFKLLSLLKFLELGIEENKINLPLSTVSNNVSTFKYEINLDSFSNLGNYLFLINIHSLINDNIIFLNPTAKTNIKLPYLKLLYNRKLLETPIELVSKLETSGPINHYIERMDTIKNKILNSTFPSLVSSLNSSFKDMIKKCVADEKNTLVIINHISSLDNDMMGHSNSITIHKGILELAEPHGIGSYLKNRYDFVYQYFASFLPENSIKRLSKNLSGVGIKFLNISPQQNEPLCDAYSNMFALLRILYPDFSFEEIYTMTFSKFNFNINKIDIKDRYDRISTLFKPLRHDLVVKRLEDFIISMSRFNEMYDKSNGNISFDSFMRMISNMLGCR